jgi:hypothetical protein
MVLTVNHGEEALGKENTSDPQADEEVRCRGVGDKNAAEHACAI